MGLGRVSCGGDFCIRCSRLENCSRSVSRVLGLRGSIVEVLISFTSFSIRGLLLVSGDEKPFRCLFGVAS